MTRRLAVQLRTATLSVAVHEQHHERSPRRRGRSRTRNANREDNKSTWAVFAEVSCCGETKRSHVIKTKAASQNAKSPGRLSLFRARSPSTQAARQITRRISLKVDWKEWCAAFDQWSRSSHITISIYARTEFDRYEYRATAQLPLCNVRTSLSAAIHVLSGERCEARAKVGLGALLADSLRDLETYVEDHNSLPRFQGFGADPDDESELDTQSTTSSVASSASSERSDHVSARSLSPDTNSVQTLMESVEAQIRSKCAQDGWASLLTAPLDGQSERHLTFSRKQVIRILTDLGASCSRREWSRITRHFDPGNDNKIPFRRIKSFLDHVESENAAIVPFAGSPRRSRSPLRTRFHPGQDVEAQFLGGNAWLPAVVERLNRDGKTLEIKFEDGSYERRVPLSRVRARLVEHSLPRHLPNFDETESLDSSPSLAEADWTPALQEALAVLRRGIRRAKAAAAKHGGAVFSFPALLEDFADIPTRPGRISLASLQDAFRAAQIRPLPRHHFDELCAVLDPKGTGSADWKRLIDLLERGQGYTESSVAQSGIFDSADEVLLRLEKALRRARGRNMRPVDAFELFATKDSTLVSLKSVAKACALLGCTLTDAEVSLLERRTRILAPNTPAGQIDYVELLRLARSGAGINGRAARAAGTRNPATDASDALERVRQQLLELTETRREAADVRKPFAEIDRAGDGTVSFPQYISAVRKLGLVVPMEDLRAVASLCAPRNGDLEGPRQETLGPRVDYGKFEALMHAEEALARAIQAQLRVAAARGVSAWAAFRALDKRDEGEISRVDFRQTCLRTLGLRLRESELRRLMSRFQRRKSEQRQQAGRIDYVAFLDFVAPHGEAGAIQDHDLSGLEASIRNSIRTAALLHEAGADLDLQAIFANFDSSGRSHCTQAEFFAGLSKLGLQFSASERRSLLARFDPRARDEVDYAGFVHFAGFSDLELDQLAARVLRRLREVQADGTDYMDVFRVYDLADDGRVSRREFREAARVLALPVTEVEVAMLARRFAQFDNADLVHYKDLLRWIVSRQDRAASREAADIVIAQDRQRRLRQARAGDTKVKAWLRGSATPRQSAEYLGICEGADDDRLADGVSQQAWRALGVLLQLSKPRSSMAHCGH
ncbi:Hypothetical Protein FCC1311_030922 [Hondaea fermentalgiana]|uniref:EF-hand domain-containing protein n=1 Tax=Hondaea fermentalgiana TaxID=2315210 RepID=A0A2R5G797_9STRA|nr:Hypothetical Protein FCC1311_030922 [Hondaea fermentalgiana]|eukprot:GBG26870.1 Hypothetical Protein FCC1311_030922 [Hondaea fermentalgiana]